MKHILLSMLAFFPSSMSTNSLNGGQVIVTRLWQHNIFAYPQSSNLKVTLSEKNATLEKVLNAISRQTGITYFGESTWVQVAHKVTISVNDAPYTEALAICFKDQPLRYNLVDGSISIHVIRMKDYLLKGYILNEKEEPISGASIIARGTSNASNAITDELGAFSIFLGKKDTSILIRCVNYETKEIRYTGQKEIKVMVKSK